MLHVYLEKSDILIYNNHTFSMHGMYSYCANSAEFIRFFFKQQQFLIIKQVMIPV